MYLSKLSTIAVSAMALELRSKIIALFTSLNASHSTDENDYDRFDLPSGGTTFLVRYEDDRASSVVVDNGGKPIESSAFVSNETSGYNNKSTLVFSAKSKEVKRVRNALSGKSIESLPLSENMSRVLIVTAADDGHIGLRYGNKDTRIGDFQNYDIGTASPVPAIVIAVA